MKSAFFILLFLIYTSAFADIATISTPDGRVRSINLIENLGYQYADWEYTTSTVLNNVVSDSNKITLSDDYSLELNVGDDMIIVNVYGQSIKHKMGMPALYSNNRIIIPFKDYLVSLDSLGICKIVSFENNNIRIGQLKYVGNVPIISQYDHKFNMAYYKRVYKEVKNKYKKKYYKPKVSRKDKTIELLKDALSEEEEPKKESSNDKDTYYDIPRELNREEVLKKKKN
ncbi:MAG: hypothetical protein ACE364_04140 [Chlorobiota bacterium]